MSKEHLSPKPLNLAVIYGRGEAWRYEEGAGLTVVVQPLSGEAVQVRIPVSVMRDFLARYERRASTDSGKVNP